MTPEILNLNSFFAYFFVAGDTLKALIALAIFGAVLFGFVFWFIKDLTR